VAPRLGDNGYDVPPTVLADVPDDAPAMREEPFGPLALLSPVRALDQAIENANSLPYGLAAYTFTATGGQGRSSDGRHRGAHSFDQALRRRSPKGPAAA
jgi:succinate-semialdehyde dehydrogenase/glutarate-semialdehyde dehydrogenase